MEKLVSKEFNNNIYTNVEEYTDILENKTIYYFYNAIENSNIFCIKENNEYIKIKDNELINKIEEVKELKLSEVFFINNIIETIIKQIRNPTKMTENERNAFFEQQYEKLRKMNIENVDYEKLKKAIFRSSGSIYMAEDINGADGVYFRKSGNIYIKKNTSKAWLHETIHRITFASLKALLLPKGFLEGATESLNLKSDEEHSYIRIYSSDKKDEKGIPLSRKEIIFNNDGSYPISVTLLRQIEIATGMTADKDILEGNNNILKEFKQRYGEEILNTVMHTMNADTRTSSLIDRLFHDRYSNEELINLHCRTQNLLLETVFEKDYPADITPETAKKYLDKMKAFEAVRSKTEDDSFFEEYYTYKYETLREILLSKGYSPIIVEQAIKKYRPVKFNKLNPIQKCKYPPEIIAYHLKKFGINHIDENSVKIYTIKGSELDGNQIMAVNGKVIYYDNYYQEPKFNIKENMQQLGKNEQDVEQTIYTITSESNGKKDKEITKFEIDSNGILVIKNENNEKLTRLAPDNEERFNNSEIVNRINGILVEEKNESKSEFNELVSMQEFSKVQQIRITLRTKIKDWMELRKNKNQRKEKMGDENNR